ncbi:hypothetical protein, partial [Streptomyces bambusae]
AGCATDADGRCSASVPPRRPRRPPGGQVSDGLSHRTRAGVVFGAEAGSDLANAATLRFAAVMLWADLALVVGLALMSDGRVEEVQGVCGGEA